MTRLTFQLLGGVTVYPGQKVNDVTVTYTKNKSPEVTQKATLEIIDNNDTNAPKQLASFSNEGNWQADKSAFTNVKSPDLSKDGYTPSLENVQFNAPERNVNQRVTVVYNRSAQAADLQIIDDNDPQNQRVLATYSAGGESGKQINFDGSNTQLQTYLNNGYTFEKYEGQGMSGDAQNGFTYPSFDNDSQSNQSFKIYLKHATANKTATTTAHVHYIMADGTKAPDDSAIQTINWTQTNTVDRVTGATVNEGTWSSDKNAFTDVDSPTVTGYTPGTKTVKFATPERGVNQVVNVVYTKDAPTPDQQNALVVYQDVNDLAHPVDLGQSEQLTGQAGDSINYSTADRIAGYEK